MIIFVCDGVLRVAVAKAISILEACRDLKDGVRINSAHKWSCFRPGIYFIRLSSDLSLNSKKVPAVRPWCSATLTLRNDAGGDGGIAVPASLHHRQPGCVGLLKNEGHMTEA